jgi:putative ABC transport system permease protein
VTQSEHDLARQNAGALSTLFSVIDVISGVLLLILGAIVAGMIVFATDERTTEYAVLRALGFSAAMVGLCVSAEAVLTGVFGALLGTLGGLFGTMLVERMTAHTALASVLPGAFSVSGATLAMGFLAASSLALFASLLPALRASRVEVSEELRRQG